MFKTRLISGICLVIIAVALIVTGGNVLLAALAIISLIGMFELYRVVGIEKSALGAAGSGGGPLLCDAVFQTGNRCRAGGIFYRCAYGTACGLCADVSEIQSGTGADCFFRPLLCGRDALLYLPHQSDGRRLSGLADILKLRGCDTCAYCVGILIGKHKMAPKLSPKKSIEGSIGGVVGATVLGAVFGAVFAAQIKLPSPVLGCAVICFVGAWISQLGDLAASAIKRNHEVKDYGRLIPGHGGILDRFDSVIFVAPAIYFTALCLLQGLQVWGLFL